MLQINKEKCSNCGQCVINCPIGAIDFDVEDRPMVVDADECLGFDECGDCQDKCPTSAITL